MDIGTPAVIAFSLFLAAWYGLGYLYNRSRGEGVRRWLEDGLRALGGEQQIDWIGSPASGVQAMVSRAAAPFRRLEFIVLLENREIPFLWLLDRLRGKPDRLIIDIVLRSPRQVEMEVRPGRFRPPPGDDWIQAESSHGLVMIYRGSEGGKVAEALMPWLEYYGRDLQRLIWRKRDPHVQIQMKVEGPVSVPGAVFISDLRRIAG